MASTASLIEAGTAAGPAVASSLAYSGMPSAAEITAALASSLASAGMRSATTSPISAGVSGASRNLRTLGRRSSSASQRRALLLSSSSRSVATTMIGCSRRRTARKPSSSSEDSSAQCMSSRTSRTGVPAVSSVRTSSTRTNRRCRRLSMSPDWSSSSNHPAWSRRAAANGPYASALPASGADSPVSTKASAALAQRSSTSLVLPMPAWPVIRTSCDSPVCALA